VLPRLPARLRYNPVAFAAFKREGRPTS
jgi:hypothetical protein